MKLYEFCAQYNNTIKETRNISLFAPFIGFTSQLGLEHCLDSVFIPSMYVKDNYFHLVLGFSEAQDGGVKFIKVDVHATFSGVSAKLDNYEGFKSTAEVKKIVEILEKHLNSEME